MKLTKIEKHFISCFVERCNVELKPSIEKTISLYTFLDGTHETRRQQEKQIYTNDPFIADRLRIISDCVDDEKVYKKEVQQLVDEGYWTSPTFRANFRAISEWLWLVDSDRVRRRVLLEFEELEKQREAIRLEQDRIRKAVKEEREKIEAAQLKRIREQNKSPEAQELYRQAMVRLATNSFAKPEKIQRQTPAYYKPEGATECYMCQGKGETAIGRVCSKCLGRGFLTKILN